jgi:hypothetical protein
MRMIESETTPEMRRTVVNGWRTNAQQAMVAENWKASVDRHLHVTVDCRLYMLASRAREHEGYQHWRGNLARQQQPFMDRYMAGEVDESAIDDAIDAWHEDVDTPEFAAYIGMTVNEYHRWLLEPRSAASAEGCKTTAEGIGSRMRHLIFDLEILHEINGPEGYTWDDTAQLGICCAGVYDMTAGRFHLYGPGDEAALRATLEAADRVTTFNGLHFDFPVAYGVGREACPDLMRVRSDDLLRRIWQAVALDPDVFTDAHRGYGLDAVCKATIGRGKTGYGGDAPTWYAAGQWARVATYCMHDVALTRDLCVFIDTYGYFINPVTQQWLAVPRWEPER